MIYTFKSHPTRYEGVLFRSRLESRWAAFFDLVGWAWEYEPFDLIGWTPDFLVIIPCTHSECYGSHSLLVEVKPHRTIEEFAVHPCTKFPYGEDYHGRKIPADASAAFGYNPSVTAWDMVHGDGGGLYTVESFIDNWRPLWDEAGLKTQYLPTN